MHFLFQHLKTNLKTKFPNWKKTLSLRLMYYYLIPFFPLIIEVILRSIQKYLVNTLMRVHLYLWKTEMNETWISLTSGEKINCYLFFISVLIHLYCMSTKNNKSGHRRTLKNNILNTQKTIIVFVTRLSQILMEISESIGNSNNFCKYL